MPKHNKSTGRTCLRKADLVRLLSKVYEGDFKQLRGQDRKRAIKEHEQSLTTLTRAQLIVALLQWSNKS